MSVIPNEWLCPITLELMRDPVIGSDGHTYERAAIVEWLGANRQSPMTRTYMEPASLRPNIALRNTIESFLASAAGPVITSTIKTPVFDNAPITASAKLITKGDNTLVHLRLTPPETGSRQGTVMIAILDNSGSMGEPASMGDGTESFGFTRLDLVKHAVRTMAATLNDADSLAIVTFSTAARVVVAPTAMDDAGKARINAALDTIYPDASTNIWDGIRQAATIANKPELAGRNIVALLLTDGFPTINPPRGIVPTLKSRLDMKNPWTLHTFGFGYNLDSVLLAEIARWGHGLFGFIPDCSMVGTVFINFLANMLSTAAINTKITHVGLSEGGMIASGPIMYGQPRNYFLPAASTVDLKYNGMSVQVAPLESDPRTTFYAEYIDVITQALHEGKHGSVLEAQKHLAHFEVKHNTQTDPAIQAMLRDVRSTDPSEGQIGLAPTYFQRWGEHYMRSYLRAQELQQCMNFKDPGLQIYGGDLFHAIQDEADKLFVTLPPPTPSGRSYSSSSATAPVSMSVFHNASNGCFHGDCQIRMADDTKKPLNAVKTGQQVWTPSGPATVDMVVVCGSYAKSQPMTQIGTLCITPWHPIRWEGRWEFPANIASYTDRLIQTVYNLVLDSGHIVEVEGVECCTLAHGFEEPVVKHPYFGTERILDDLLKQMGAEYGRPTFTNLKSIRDPDSGIIVRWVDAPYDLPSSKW